MRTCGDDPLHDLRASERNGDGMSRYEVKVTMTSEWSRAIEAENPYEAQQLATGDLQVEQAQSVTYEVVINEGVR